MERLFGLFYIISIPLWIVYVCIDSIDKNLFKRRKRYIVFHELVFLSLGIWAVHENSDRNWIVPVVVVAEILVFFLYDLIRKWFRYIFRGLKFLLFPFYYTICPKNIKKMNRRLYRDATGEDPEEEWEPWNEPEEELGIEQKNEYHTDEEEIRGMLMADHISLKNALYVFGFKKIGEVTEEDLKLRYHYLAKRFHSDNTKEDECIMKGINIAHEKLLNFEKK